MSNDVAETDALRAALRTLPDVMRDVLWLTEVDDQPPQVVVARSGTDPRAIAVKAMRARRALGSAYLSEHVAIVSPQTSVDRTCADARPYLAGVVRDTVGIRRRRRVEEHLQDCEACTGAHAALRRLNRHLRSTVAPASVLAAIKEHVLAWLTASTTPIAAGAVVAASVVAPVTVLTIPDHAATSRRLSETSEPVPLSAPIAFRPLLTQPDEPDVGKDLVSDAPTPTAAAHATPTVSEHAQSSVASGSAMPAAVAPAPVTTTAPRPPAAGALDADDADDDDGDEDHGDAADADDGPSDAGRDHDADDRPQTVGPGAVVAAATATCAAVGRRGGRCSTGASDHDADDVQSDDADDVQSDDADDHDADDHDADDQAADDHDADDHDNDHDADDGGTQGGAQEQSGAPVDAWVPGEDSAPSQTPTDASVTATPVETS